MAPQHWSRFLHPLTGKDNFGSIPNLPELCTSIADIPIILRYGFHKSAHNGYGATHIWAEHREDVKPFAVNCIEDVGIFVAKIISGKALFYKANPVDGKFRISIYQRDVGSVILEFNRKVKGLYYWNVITAYNAKLNKTKCLGSICATKLPTKI